MKRLLQKISIGLISLLGVAVGGMLFAQPASAAGETYTWKDFRTITVSGGQTQGPVDFLLSSGVPLVGDQSGGYVGTITYTGLGKPCTIHFTIYTYKTSTPQGYLWSPAGIIPVPPEAGSGNFINSCNSQTGNYNTQLQYHDKWINLQGTRPTDPNAPERPEEKRFTVLVNASDPQSTAPKTDTVFIYSGDGKTKIKELTAPFVSQNGQANWPPNQTPMAMNVIFEGLEPGDYIACDTYVAKNCTDPAKLAPGQKFTKKKYAGTDSTTLGAAFLTPDKKRIRGHVEFHVKAPCGSSVSVSPVQIELTGPDGKVYAQQTEGKTVNPGGNESGALCTKDVAVGLYAEWNDMPPGDYKACATGAECITIHKPENEGIEDFTLVILGEDQAPPDEKVCTSGDGVAGALAWIICPATQLVAAATDFFENNIIIPFLTVSPLTTNADNPIYILWRDFRDLANVGFIVLLFISIFSIALSKYGLKRVLPRLFLAVIGINLSYFIVGFIIDAFNIFGAGVSQLVMAALQQAGTTQLNTGTSAGTVRSIFTLGGAALLAIIVTGGAALGWLFSFLGLAALVVVVTVVVLIMRQMAIIVLVVFAPLAILMYMLPNTENYFKKWRQMLIQLLMMYPMIVLLFATGKIFGLVLQQPDFKLAGDGVSDEVAQGVRVILQFLVYVIPLVLLPATFAASGSLMKRAYGLASNRRLRGIAQKPGQAFGENVVKPARQEMQQRAAQRGGAIGWAAGYGQRSRFKKEQRQRELEHAGHEYVTGVAASNDKFAASAAGIGGQAGVTRVRASAVSAVEKTRQQEIANERAIFNNELRQLGLSPKEFNSAFSDYLKDPKKNVVTGKMRDAQGNVRTIDLNQRQDLSRSALNSAAAAGEITTIEQARMSKGVNQGMLDDVIRNNEGSIKSKGGYHLATNFNLAEGRSQGTQRDIHIERLRRSFGAGGEDIAGMKASFVGDVAKTLRDPTTRADILGPGGLTADERRGIKNNINTILSAPDISGGAKNLQALKDIESLL
jgi:hypothetical protein